MISHVTLPVKLDYVLIDILIDVLISQIIEAFKKNQIFESIFTGNYKLKAE